MAANNLNRCLELVFGSEGGLSTIRSDPGNWTGGAVGKGDLKGTKFGISAASYPSLNIASLTLTQAAEIYRRDYWTEMRGELLPLGVDYAVFDYAVNSGVSRAVRALQGVVGTTKDGVLGPKTLGAAASKPAAQIISALCAQRLAYLKRLKTWPTFGRGWTTRVEKVEREALAMQAAPLPRQKPQPVIDDFDDSVMQVGTPEPAKPSLLSRIIAAILSLFKGA